MPLRRTRFIARHSGRSSWIKTPMSTGCLKRASMRLLGGALRGARVLEIGAGECSLASALAVAGASEVHAIDAVPRQMWAAAAYYATTPGREFVIGSALDLPFETGSFDVVVAHLVLHHIEPLKPVLEEIRRVLRSGGAFYAKEPSPIVGVIVERHLSENEAALPLKRVVRELRDVGFGDIDHWYWWSRLNTSLSRTALTVLSRRGVCSWKRTAARSSAPSTAPNIGAPRADHRSDLSIH